MNAKDRFRAVPNTPYEEKFCTADRLEFTYRGKYIPLYGLTDLLIDNYFNEIVGQDALYENINNKSPKDVNKEISVDRKLREKKTGRELLKTFDTKMHYPSNGY